MVCIAITQAAFDAICATLALGRVGYENAINEGDRPRRPALARSRRTLVCVFVIVEFCSLPHASIGRVFAAESSDPPHLVPALIFDATNCVDRRFHRESFLP
jgi:hypothetical protein